MTTTDSRTPHTHSLTSTPRITIPEGCQAPWAGARPTGFLIHELTRRIPPVDDISAMVACNDGHLRFRYGDEGEGMMTRHLWDCILEQGVDEELREQLREQVPPSLGGPLPVKAGLSLVRCGAFTAVAVHGDAVPVRWVGGTLLTGGHAHRMVARDVELRPHEQDQIVACFSCEGGRGNAVDRRLRVVEGLLAPPVLRGLALAADQFTLWSEVAALCHRFAPSCRSLVELMATGTLGSLLHEESPRWETPLRGDDCTGAVLVLDGFPLAADLFEQHRDLMACSAALVQSYLLQAMAHRGAHTTEGVEIHPAHSEEGKVAIKQLLLELDQGGLAERTTWHTLLLSRRLSPEAR